MTSDFPWMDTIKTNIAAISGLENRTFGYDKPPASIEGLCAVILFEGGTWEYSLGGPLEGTYDVQIIIYTPAQILGEAMSQAAAFILPVRNKMAGDIQLGGLVKQILPTPDRRTFEGPGQIAYGENKFMGVAFFYRVELNETGTYTPAA